jgi:Family of unknown function (DUF6533)
MASNYCLIASFGELKAFVTINSTNSPPLESALLAFDAILTLSHEIGYIWNNKFKLGTALYLLARYMGLLHLLLVIILNWLNFTSLQVFCSDEFRLCT